MVRVEPSDLELEDGQSSEELSEEEEEPDSPDQNVSKQAIPDYEKQRLSRMAENKARMEALGLHKMASSLMGSAQKSMQPRKSIQIKGKRKLFDEDDDYKPNDDDDASDEDFESKSPSKSRRNTAKNKGSKPKKKVISQKHFSSTDYIDEDNDELMQAIALSLQDSAKENLENTCIQEDPGRKRKKKSFSNRVQMTEDELILHFFQFDESGRGFLTVRDLQRVVTAHDFTWTDRELADMVHCFDSDGDGKLNLDDFRKIAGRCNMIRGSENC